MQLRSCVLRQKTLEAQVEELKKEKKVKEKAFEVKEKKATSKANAKDEPTATVKELQAAIYNAVPPCRTSQACIDKRHHLRQCCTDKLVASLLLLPPMPSLLLLPLLLWPGHEGIPIHSETS